MHSLAVEGGRHQLMARGVSAVCNRSKRDLGQTAQGELCGLPLKKGRW